jgi:hypothetical protein
MKTKLVLTGLISMMLVLGLFLSGCDTGTGTGSSSTIPETRIYSKKLADDSTYTLTITQNTSKAAYDPQPGDSYVLIIVSVNGTGKTSSGKVTSFDANSGTLTLTPSKGSITFTVTVTSSGGLTTISNTITFDDGTSQTPPDELKPGGGGGEVPTDKVIEEKYRGIWKEVPEEGFLEEFLSNNIRGWIVLTENELILYKLDSDIEDPTQYLKPENEERKLTYLYSENSQLLFPTPLPYAPMSPAWFIDIDNDTILVYSGLFIKYQ